MDARLDVIILGGGLSGLSAGYNLSKKRLLVCEKDGTVGGLSRTVVRGGFRFDLGGHRFFTKNKKIEAFVKGLLKEELTIVPRTSKIYFNGKYFDYPLTPRNAIFGMGVPTTLKIIFDYFLESLKNSIVKPRIVSLEDWVVSKFGRAMFNLYFKAYTEKVWGIDSSRICAGWVEQRIKGMSLKVAIEDAFFKKHTTLIEEFIYPSLGIGRLSERLKEGIEKNNKVLLNAEVVKVNHENFTVNSVEIKGGEEIKADSFISTIPVTNLAKIMNPRPPGDVLKAVKGLRYRDLITVNLMINRENVTDVKWVYIHDPEIPFGRIHEPKNWSVKMAPEGKTSLVVEYFCFEGDRIWNKSDRELVNLTVSELDRLGFIRRSEVFDSLVLRIKNAYPLHEIGYEKHCRVIYRYLKKFKNLQAIGRSGRYKYLNMDHAIADGIKAAGRI